VVAELLTGCCVDVVFMAPACCGESAGGIGKVPDPTLMCSCPDQGVTGYRPGGIGAMIDT
jgi:hypothetical protein